MIVLVSTMTQTHEIVKRRRIYVTGHRNPDLDSIASAIGYAELKRRLDGGNEYVAGAPRRAQRPDRVGARSEAAPSRPS